DTTPSRFIRTVRVECAAELLRQGAGSVTEVAYSVGSESLSYFSRAFRERFGATPSDLLRLASHGNRMTVRYLLEHRGDQSGKASGQPLEAAFGRTHPHLGLVAHLPQLCAIW
ncbi:MAG TPA: helix-turn-helix transcriptional regulator, partial [Longimicrobiaceae bacterium]|nr:helix-turn-helix transcriptional regulator [Longimicrobiaceae bacterium]